jgi:alkylated DNA repair dioxygenase AlkB
MQLFPVQKIPLPLTDSSNGHLTFWPDWLDNEHADAYLRTAIDSVSWQADNITIFGKSIPVPRLHSWYCEPLIPYVWSGIKMRANPFPQWLDQLRLRVQSETGCKFNSCLANYYRTGMDSVDWHADDEEILGDKPIVASISLGAARIFQLRHRLTKQRFDLSLPHGSLSMMGPGVQQYWQHRVPKCKSLGESRVNFTFRRVQVQSAAR